MVITHWFLINAEHRHRLNKQAIDKAKGIVCKPMPREWYDRHAVNKIENDDVRRFYRDIVADKKPYFMRYIYPALMRQYNTYIRNTNRSALREFKMTIDEMIQMPYSELTEQQDNFLRYYRSRMPVGVGNCVMNRICRRFEEAFDGFIGKHSNAEKFNYSIMKSGAKYSTSQFNAVKKLYEEYNKRMQSYAIFSFYDRVDEDESVSAISNMREEFVRSCDDVCQNSKTMCDIILDICYCKSASKKFAWDICGDTIIHNLLDKNDWTISFPTEDPDGDISYGYGKYKMISKKIGEDI